MRTVRLENGVVSIIDQRKLPHKLSYLRCRSSNQVAEAIKTMAVRGAPAIGVAAAAGLALAAYRSKAKTMEALLKDLERAEEKLRNTRPTAVNLFWALERVMRKARSATGSAKEAVNMVISEVRKMAEEDVETNRKIGEEGASLIRDGDSVLTHCKWLS